MQTLINDLIHGWRLYKTSPNDLDSPKQLVALLPEHESVPVPGTVAMAVCDQANPWKLSEDITHFDWWYVLDFAASDHHSHPMQWLEFQGLATLAEVWLNDLLILQSDNAFRSHQLDVSKLLKAHNRLSIVFRSQQTFLEQKHPRPRWKTRLVNNQNMRWLRSTVLGYVDSWTPPIKLIGPWRKVRRVASNVAVVDDWLITSSLNDNKGVIQVSGTIRNATQQCPEFVLQVAGQRFPLDSHNNAICHRIEINNIDAWMPHTHGHPTLYDYQLIAVDGEQQVIYEQGKLGFKQVSFNHDTSQLSVNGKAVFCRGTCWTVSDYHAFNCDADKLRRHLSLLRDAGVNMIRVGGTMVYESDDFYQLCSELGIMVWQDFMFASMDYPFEDDDFRHNVEAEVRQQVQRIARYAAISVWCGNTDVEAQVAMFGLPDEWAKHAFYHEFIEQLCQSYSPKVPYFPSSPTGGTLAFHLSSGVAHYWGTGAYMHDLPDPDADRVKFCSEGMGLSHIPEQSIIDQTIGKQTLFPYHSEWRSRIPRDLGAGWDFEDIRDHYLKQVFNVEPNHLRRHEVERYIQLSTLVTGKAIADVFRRWRRPESQTQGGLIWFNKDFWPCPGFGLIDSNDYPKAAYYLIRQAWKNQTLIFESVGLDGLLLHVINESPKPLSGCVSLQCYAGTHLASEKIDFPVDVAAASSISFSIEQLFGRFVDPSYAYRFGPPAYSAISAALTNNDKLVDTSLHYVTEEELPKVTESSITAKLSVIDDERLLLTLNSTEVVQYLKINTSSYLPEDNYFTLIPGVTRTVILTLVSQKPRRIKVLLTALNLSKEIRVALASKNS